VKVVFSSEGVRAPAGVSAVARRGVLRALRRVRGPAEVQIVWVTRRRLRAMGKRFRDADKFTDVISFRHDDDLPVAPGEPRPFGDLYIAPDQARMNAVAFGASFVEECVRLCVHGALHLLGHRDYAPAERKRMWAVQERIMKDLRLRPTVSSR
jgi:probable rRNA maturation factor